MKENITNKENETGKENKTGKEETGKSLLEEPKTTLYQQIIDGILVQIDKGRFSFDEPICTENSLMEEYGFSRITIRRALSELENMGILYRKRGVGSFVCRDIYEKQNPAFKKEMPASPDVIIQPKEQGTASLAPTNKLFALVFPFNLTQTGLTAVVQAASEYLMSKGCFASVYISGEGDHQKGRHILGNLIHMNVDGVAYYPITQNVHLEQLNDFLFQGKPVVVMDIPSSCPYVPSVVSDNLAGSTLLAEHLIGLGHRKIAYVAGIGPSAKSTVADRLAGYVLTHTKYGLPLNSDFICTTANVPAQNADPEDPTSLAAMLHKLMEQGVTAIMAEHDGLAYKILLTCHDCGIRVPEQLSVCGFDNSEWATALANSTPPLRITTIAQDQAAVGRKVAELLYEGLQNPIRKTEPVVIPVKLIEGNTTGPAPTFP